MKNCKYILIAPLVFLLLCGNANAETISCQEAYARLRKDSKLETVSISEKFDLSKIHPKPHPEKTIKFSGVKFNKKIIHSEKTIDFSIEFDFCEFDDEADFSDSLFKGESKFSSCKFNGTAKFTGSVFKERSEFTSCIFGNGGFYITFFTRCKFDRAVFFDSTTFPNRLEMDSVSFEDNASFLECKIINSAKFTNSKFAGKADFRYCTMEHVVFGINKYTTDFNGIADFRNSSLNDVFFEFVEFNKDVNFSRTSFKNGDISFKSAYFRNGMANFSNIIFDCEKVSFKETYFISSINFSNVDFKSSKPFTNREVTSISFEGAYLGGLVSNFANSNFGDCNVSFKNAYLGSSKTILDGIFCKGSINLSGVYMPSIQLHWEEIGEAILEATPRSDLLEFLFNRLNKLDRPYEALTVYNEFRQLKRKEKLNNKKTTKAEKIYAILKWIIWGWPTGYGTKLVRSLCYIFGLWALFSIPIFLKKGIILKTKHELTPDEIKGRRIYEPVYRDGVSSGTPSQLCLVTRMILWLVTRIILPLIFSFSLMFKVKHNKIIYVENNKNVRHYFKFYFIFLWHVVGPILIFIIGLTLIKTTPAFKEVFGKIAF